MCMSALAATPHNYAMGARGNACQVVQWLRECFFEKALYGLLHKELFCEQTHAFFIAQRV